jgi:transcriptional regulator with XRE-family HTH domain
MEGGQPVNTFREVWDKFSKSKKYREAFALSLFKRMVPFQIRSLRKQRDWSQAQLAESANVTQGVISRAEDPDYGKLTINTISRIAAGFDVAFIVKFVPFSELDKWFLDLSEKSVEVPSFEEENETYTAAAPVTPQEAAEDEIIARLVSAKPAPEQPQNVIDFEKKKQMMKDILSPQRQLFPVLQPMPIKSQPEARSSACN